MCSSLGKGILIELSPHISHESPMTSAALKSGRERQKSALASDSGIFEQSTATSHHPAISSASWQNNAHSSTVRDSGVYGDSAATGASSMYSRRHMSDTDQTTIHGGDDSLSRSTYKYETDMHSNDPIYQQRHIRRQITRSPPSDYENLANYQSGIHAQRKVPITTQSRSILTKPLVVDEIETIETETRVECQVQRTHEIKESTTTERAHSPNAPKKVITTTTTTTTTTHSPDASADETVRTVMPSRRVILNERSPLYESTRPTGK